MSDEARKLIAEARERARKYCASKPPRSVVAAQEIARYDIPALADLAEKQAAVVEAARVVNDEASDCCNAIRGHTGACERLRAALKALEEK